MKQANWLAESEDPYRMLNYLGRRVSSRKARLFACACFRRRKPKLKKWEEKVLQVAERYADGLASNEELQRAQERAVGSSAVAWATLAEDYWTAVEAARAAGEWRDEAVQCVLVRDLFGNPFRPVRFDQAWRTPAVLALARTAYDENRWEELPLLADALEEAGCAVASILTHCRGPGPHVRGCWVVDLVRSVE